MSINKFTTPQVFAPPETSRLSYTYKSFDLLKTDHAVPKLAKFIIATFLLPISLLADTAMLMASPFRSKRQYTVLEQMKYASSAVRLKIKSAAKSLTASAIENKSTILKVIAAVAVAGALVHVYRSYNAGVPIDSSVPGSMQQRATPTEPIKLNSDRGAVESIELNSDRGAESIEANSTRASTRQFTSLRNASSGTPSDYGFWSVLLTIGAVATGLEHLAKQCKKKSSTSEHTTAANSQENAISPTTGPNCANSTVAAPDLEQPQKFSEEDEIFLRSQCFEGSKPPDQEKMIEVPSRGPMEYKKIPYQTEIEGEFYSDMLCADLPTLSEEDLRKADLDGDEDLNVLYDYRVRKKYNLCPFDDASSS